MKLKLILTTVLLTTLFARGQNTFLYDQQSTNQIEGVLGLGEQPIGQSFTPLFPSVGFVMLKLSGTFGGTVYVNLRSDSITGTILGSTTPVFMPDRFFGITNFMFTTSITVIPGIPYYLQPVGGAGGFGSFAADGYPGGSLIYRGSLVPYKDLWFREGVVVPEPSSVFLVLLGGGVLFYAVRKKSFHT
ncbi:MAG: PEP-CTERM sorting domain-containing protein [Limisphaerales bacterium]